MVDKFSNNESPPIYCISGLGLNEKLFLKLRLNQPLQHIHWIDPLDQESLSDYCLRLSQQVKEKTPPILIGVSFGGIAAIEIAKHIPVNRVIIISSIKTDKERPWLFYLARLFPVYKFGRQRQLRFKSIKLWGWLFGLHTASARQYFLSMLSETSEKYIAWAIHQISHWQNDTYPDSLIHIHGNRDKIFPWRLIKNAILVPKGDHGMIVTRASNISDLIRRTLFEESSTVEIPSK